METICFIGTGLMGNPMIEKLIKANYDVRVYDKYPDRMETAINLGAKAFSTPAAAAQNSKIVITCLPLPEHVLENMLGEEGGLAGMEPGSVWIDCSTTDYHNTQHIAEIARKKSVYSLEAPVSNLSHMGVDFANVSFYVAGDEEGYEIAKKSLDTMGVISFYVGEIGRAQTVKLLTNLLFYTAMTSWIEILLIARANDIPLTTLWQFMKKSKGNCFVIDQCSPFVLDGSYDFSCLLEIPIKDMQLTVDLANELDVELPIGRVVNERYADVGKYYDHKDNHVTIAKHAEKQNNMRLNVEGFIAPSPYGKNRDYKFIYGFEKDNKGRTRPSLPEQYTLCQQPFSPEQEKIAELFSTFMACTNYNVFNEALELGQAMGFDQNQLKDYIKWSCGPSWVSDNLESYIPNTSAITPIMAMRQQLHLPVISELGNILSQNQHRSNLELSSLEERETN